MFLMSEVPLCLDERALAALGEHFYRSKRNIP